MAFTAVLACLIAIAAPCLCDTRFGASGYTGGLLGGIGGIPSAGLGVGAGLGAVGAGAGAGFIGAGAGPVVGLNVGFDGLDDFGSPIGVLGAGNLGGAGFGQPIGIGGAGGFGGAGVGLGGYGSSGLGSKVFSRCGYLPPLCHATNFDRFPQCKYTYDHKLGRCVKIYVRRACAFRNGPRDNIFDSIYSCKRFCH